jgi:hypothetical protein
VARLQIPAQRRDGTEAQIMCEEMALLIPDVKITASPTLMRYWTKDAVETYDANGTLIPWEKKS